MRNVKCRKVKCLDRCNFRKSTRIKSSQNVFKVFQYPRLIDPTTWIYFVTVWHYFCFKLCFLNSCYQKKKMEGWDAGLRPSSKHVGVTPGIELWTIDVFKWFISDVLKVKWQSYRAFWTLQIWLKPNCTWMFIGWSSTNFTFLFRYEIQNGGYGRT